MVKKIEVAGADVHSRAELDPLLRHIPRLLDEPAQRIPSGLLLRRCREHGFLALGGQRLQFAPVADVSEAPRRPARFGTLKPRSSSTTSSPGNIKSSNASPSGNSRHSTKRRPS